MIKLDPHQIRAARALLDWTHADLAKAAGMTADGIRKIEKGQVRPYERSINAIYYAFQNHGVEFLENSGVRFEPDGIEVLKGYEGFCRFVDGVYEYFLVHGGKVRAHSVRNEDWIRYLGEYNDIHVKRMEDLVNKRKDVELTHISQIGEEEKSKFYGGYVKYRFLPADEFESVPFYTYGNNVGILNFQAENPPEIILIKSPTVTQTFNKLYGYFWKMATE